MWHVIGGSEVARESLDSLSRAFSAIRVEPVAEKQVPNRPNGRREMDQDELENAPGGRNWVTVIDVVRLRQAFGDLDASKANHRIRRWGIIAITTWALGATSLAVMEWNTIVQLQQITAKVVKAVEDGKINK